MSDVDLARRNDIPTRHCQWKRNMEDPTCATENGLMIEFVAVGMRRSRLGFKSRSCPIPDAPIFLLT